MFTFLLCELMARVNFISSSSKQKSIYVRLRKVCLLSQINSQT